MSSSQRQRLKHKKRRDYGSFSNDDEKDILIENMENINVKNKKLNEINDCNQFCIWIKTDTFKKLKILYFFISIFIPFIIAIYYFIFEQHVIGYIIAGIYAILQSLYGLNHFRLLFNLKNEIDKFENGNNAFKYQRKELNVQINRLSQGKTELKYTHKKLQESNLKMIDMIKKFEHLEKELNLINATNYNEITNISKKTNQLKSKYYDISLQQQRNILWRIFNRLEFHGENKKGITKDDYLIFRDLLPTEHRQRFDRLGGFQTLLKISDNKNKNYIDSEDFEKALDIYAQMMVENADIKFKIDRVEAVRKVTIIERKERSGFYLRKQDIWRAVRKLSDDNLRSKSPTPLSSGDEEPVLLHQSAINQ